MTGGGVAAIAAARRYRAATKGSGLTQLAHNRKFLDAVLDEAVASLS